jgi:hypothetical protein
MRVPDLGPLTMSVLIRDDDCGDPHVREVLISAFCPKCGGRRGTPHRILEYGADGRPLLVDRWDNQCEHVDTDQALLSEVASQCMAPGCVLLADGSDYPYCSAQCAAAAPVSLHTRNAALLAHLCRERDAMVALRSQLRARVSALHTSIGQIRDVRASDHRADERTHRGDAPPEAARSAAPG